MPAQAINDNDLTLDGASQSASAMCQENGGVVAHGVGPATGSKTGADV